MNLQDKTRTTPRWLRRTQEMSWEPEILISGIVLLALTQVPRLLDSALYFLEERTLTISGDGPAKLLMLLKTAAYWLIFMLIVHLIFRSVWLSFVGLSYAFPSGIDIRKLKLQPYFENKLLRIPDFESSVIRLERICSTIYAIAFLLVMATFSAFIYLTTIIFLVIISSQLFPDFFDQTQSLDDILTLVIILTGLPYIIDFLTLGLLKRIKWFWWIYRPMYNMMSFITFSSIYRGIYYGLVTNMKKRTMISGLIIFIGITYLITVFSGGNLFDRTTLVNVKNYYLSSIDGHYRDANPQRMNKWAHIQSDVIDDNVIQLFIVHKKTVEENIIATCPDYQALSALKEKRDAIELSDNSRIFRRDSINMHCITSYYKVHLDGIPVDVDRWYTREMNESNQQGMITWIDIQDLSRGHHVLEIFRSSSSNPVSRIPFFNNAPKEVLAPVTERDSI